MVVPLTGLTRFYSPEFTGEFFEDFSYRPLSIDGDNVEWNAAGKRKILGVLSPTLAGSGPFTINLLFSELDSLTEGVLVFDGRSSLGSFSLSPTNFISTGNLSIEPKKVTVLRFYHHNNDELHWESSYTPTGLIESEDFQLVLDIRPGGYDGGDLGNLATFSHCFDLIKDRAQYIKGNRLTDSNSQKVLIRVHGDVNQTIHAKSLPPVGIKILGVLDNNGRRPVVDSEGIESQFNRNTLIDNCHGLELDGLSLKNIDSTGKRRRGCLVVTHSSRITIKNVRFLGAGTLINLLKADVHMGGNIAFAGSPTIGKIASASRYSTLDFNHIFGVSDESRNNEIIGLKFNFEDPVAMDRFCTITDYSSVSISDRLIVEGQDNLTVSSVSDIGDFCRLTSIFFS